VHKDRWLLISYYANTEGRAASHHIDDRLKPLIRQGVDVVLLSSMCGPRHKNIHHLRVYSLLPRAMLDELKGSIKRNNRHSLWTQIFRWPVQVFIALICVAMMPLEHLLVRRDKRWSWQFTATIRGLISGFVNKPDAVVTTGGPASAHVAGLWISRLLGLPLVSEFQDPLKFQYPDSDLLIHNYHTKLEKKLSEEAAQLIYLTDAAAESARQRLTEESGIISSVLSGAVPLSSPSEISACPSNGDEPLILAHVGTLSGSRNLLLLYEALELMAINERELANKFRLLLAGTLGKSVEESIDTFSLAKNVTASGKVSRDGASKVLNKADVLLLVQNRGPIARETIPSKVFEYLISGKLILALVDGNQQLSAMLQEQGHLVFDLSGSPGQLQEMLRKLFAGEVAAPRIYRFTVDTSVVELLKIVRKVT